MHHQKVGARAEYRQQQGQRVKDAGSLATRFPELKTLTVDLAYYDSEGVTQSSQIKYKVNLANAKSFFRFDCQNDQCIRGDFDLSEELARAVAAHDTTKTGELCCQGWLDKDAVGTTHCHKILRYKLTLAY
jgi:hypothetical protein